MRRILNVGSQLGIWMRGVPRGGGRARVEVGFGYNFKGHLVKKLFKGEAWIHPLAVYIQVIHHLLRVLNCEGRFPLHLQEVEGITFCMREILHPGQLVQENCIPRVSTKCQHPKNTSKTLTPLVVLSAQNIWGKLALERSILESGFIRTQMEPMTISFMSWTEVNRI